MDTRLGRGGVVTVAGSTTRQSQAVEAATRNLRHVHVPVLGEVEVPPPEKVAFYAGMGVMAAVGLIDWPVAIVITAGHVLADQKMFSRIRGLGAAAEEA